MSINCMKTGGKQWICTHTSFTLVVDVVRWCFVCTWLCVSLCSLQDWVWPAGLTRWWRYTRPPRMTSCCVCSEGSCAPTRTEWASWWERWWTTSRGQFHNQTPNKPHQFYPAASSSAVFEMVSVRRRFRDITLFDSGFLFVRTRLRVDTVTAPRSVMMWPGDNAKAKKNYSFKKKKRSTIWTRTWINSSTVWHSEKTIDRVHCLSVSGFLIRK